MEIITESNDIETHMNKMYNSSPIKKWIKLINFNDRFNWNNYIRKDNFQHVADIILDVETHQNNIKKRNSLIQFIPKIDINKFNMKNEWVYIFLINDMIVKIGGTRTGLKGRVNSYLCGHHVEARGKSGSCSKTNAYIYNTFYFYLLNGFHIKMFAFEIPIVKQICSILDQNIEITLQTYHAYESIYLNDFKKIYGSFPTLSDNCDPNYHM